MNTPMNNKDFASCVLARIEAERITPKPRWHFLMREGVVWTLGALSVGVGALSISAILFEARMVWWHTYLITHPTLFDFVLYALPFAWIVVFALFVFAAYLSLRHTKGGYRYRLSVVVAVSLTASGVCGAALYAAGAGRFVDERVGAWVPMHEPLSKREGAIWHRSSEGRVVGMVREVSYSEPLLWVETIEGDAVAIDTSLFHMADRDVLVVGDMVRVIGVFSSSSPNALFGCVMLVGERDVLRTTHQKHHDRMAPLFERGDVRHERNVVAVRNTLCEGVRPYTRFLSR